MIVGGSLNLDDQVIPAVDGVAGETARYPVLSRIVPGVPFVTSRNPAFMSPDERFPILKLVDVELQCLSKLHIAGIEPHVIGEVVKFRNESVASVRKTL